MKRQIICLSHLLLLSVLLVGCVEEFEANLPPSETIIPVVEGTIVSDSACVFTFSRTVALDAGAWEPTAYGIKNVNMSVHGDDGSSWPAQWIDGGRYVVNVGHLNPSVAYHIEFAWNGNKYTSTPAYPLSTPAITNLRAEHSTWEPNMNVFLSADAAEEGCYFWSFDECWEINTPYVVSYLYDLENDCIIPKALYQGRGWCYNTRLPMIGTSDDYGGAGLADTHMLSIYCHDNRFNTLYSVLVTQRAVSRAEYEHEHLLEQQSYEMGGLFTPLPSTLPGNIRCTNNPDLQVIGFVGVSAGTTCRRLFISSKEAGYVLQRTPHELTDDEIGELTWAELYKRGFRVHTYSEILGVKWTYRWCNDCTDPYWGATRNRPDFWPDDEEDDDE